MDYKEKVIALLNSKELSQKQKEKLKDIFSEFKEDEDERIRKDIIAYLQYTIAFDKTFIDKKFNWSQKGCSTWITWLKEQGEHVNFLSKIQIGDKVTRNEDGVLVNLSQLNRIAKSNKTKPKFKVGDFIVSTYCIGKVIELTNDAYLLDTGQGISFSYEHNAHIWTIKDAKNGDVLNSIRVKATIIFKEWNSDSKHINAYCALQKGILIKQEMVWDRDFEPATKEQCDTLMKAMTDAGYIFDFEKKELKKIENEIEIPFGAKDNELQEATYYIPKGFHAEIDDDKVIIKKGEKPTKWSEEDENLLNKCITNIQMVDSDDTLKIWLKSLKDRIRLNQNKS